MLILKYSLILTIITSVVNIIYAQHYCPSRCVCFHATVRCMFLQLENIPKVSSNTAILDLRFNKVRRIPPNTFKDLSDLSTLLLNNNQLVTIQRGSFNGLKKLKYLYLYKNKIKKIESQSFRGLKSLEQLYIHFNRIGVLAPNTFINLPSLKRLFLHNNRLKKIPKGALKHLKSLTRLRLDSNALICDCELVWLAQMLRPSGRSRNIQASGTCESPDDLHGKSLTDVSFSDFNCESPKLTEQPSDVDVTFGGTVYFSCKAEGDPNPKIVWLHNNNEIDPELDDEGRFSVLDDGTLMIAPATGNDQGVYECLAKNVAGETKSRKAKMVYKHRQEIPSFIETPISQSVFLGSTVTFPCTVTGSPTPLLRWSKDGVVLANNPHHRLSANGTLTVFDVTKNDVGSYECSASNRLGRVGTSAQLIINGPPIFAVDPSDVVISEGQDAVLRCSAEGSPEPRLTWTKDGRAISTNSKHHLSDDYSVLTVRNVREVDQGAFRCEASNSFGRISEYIELSIKKNGVPYFIRSPSDVSSVEGSNVELSCPANGDPLPDIAWTKDGDRILTDDSRRHFGHRGKLFVYNVTEEDSGIYECAADNSVGFASASIQLSVLKDNDFISNAINDNNIRPSVQRAKDIVNESVNDTIARLTSGNPSGAQLLRLFRFPPEGHPRSVALAAEVYERALKLVKDDVEGVLKRKLSDRSYLRLLSAAKVERIANLSGCMAHRKVNDCQKDICFHRQFRSFDGTCNNLANPLWGSSIVPFKRLLPAVYENGFNTPVGWSRTRRYHGHSKPSSRLISSRLMSSDELSDDLDYTHMLMQWGQFLDHDLDHALEAVSRRSFTESEVDCDDSCENSHPCFPIEVPSGDHRIRRSRCIGFARSSAICGSGYTSVFFNAVVPRQQANQITSYIDASNVYGSCRDDAEHLRDSSTDDDGKLRHGLTLPLQKPLLPFNTQLPVDCRREAGASDIGCFVAGDLRVNEQLGLTSMHTLWMREHNRIASNLRRINPHWTGNKIYHTCRKIVGAQMQRITYQHWLPKILGPGGMSLLGTYDGYDSRIDSTISNVFATAAFRFGHSLINPVLHRLDSTLKEIRQGHMPLYKAFFAPHLLIEEGGVDPIIRGLFVSASKMRKTDQLVSSVLTERLFELSHDIALDLSAMNIQRGRDHALPEYNSWREFCNLTVAESFDDFRHEIRNQTIRQKMKAIYGHPGNVDLFVGGMLEDSIPGSRIGPTFSCIIADQFRRLRDGDRFWYENPSVFTPDQLNEIKRSSLSSVICHNGDNITQVTRDVFVTPRKQRPHYIRCDDVPTMDLNAWIDCQRSSDCSGRGCQNGETEIDRVRRSIKHSGGEDDDSRLDDLTEERLESLEAVVQKLQKSIGKMTKRVKRLERKLVSKIRQAKCKGGDGRRHSVGHKWRENRCKVCRCLLVDRKSVTSCEIPSDC